MDITHPDAEQLAGYMESPESGQHHSIRKHLMACDQCRVQVDKLAQLEIDIKHYVPRLAIQQGLADDLQKDNEHIIERYVDNQLNPAETLSIKQQIHDSPDMLKTALHYATHSATMSRNIASLKSTSETKNNERHNMQRSAGFFFNYLLKFFQWPTPAWAMVPAVLVITAAISLPLIGLKTNSQNVDTVIAKFQDNAVISYTSTDIPKGSIGFFHDAKSSTEPFAGMDIKVNSNQGLDFSWPPINKVESYTFTVYEFKNGMKQEIAVKTTNKTNASLDSVNWVNGNHYQWQINGVTLEGLKYTTNGDFIFVQHNSD